MGVAYKRTAFLDLIANISTVSQCSTLCRAHTGCNYWTLYKSGTYAGWCNLLGEVEHQIDTQEAVSGNAECGDVTTTTNSTHTPVTSTSPICTKLANTIEHCISNPKNMTDGYDAEHCKRVLDDFNKFCGDMS